MWVCAASTAFRTIFDSYADIWLFTIISSVGYGRKLE